LPSSFEILRRLTPITIADLSSPSYQVLARKYRPVTFADLRGQDALVRTLTNAIASERIAHAFLLTGIRGIGKTTTARIIARSLNCVGTDGKGGATIEPCGQCVHCVSIREDRHPDILEMDAASRTGVESMREIIENSRYLPTMARYKIYIIDEVHMLTNNAFNALLKTLEEPPPHVKFILATTETRKIPVTIVSRCQRFDLRRLSSDMLQAHLQDIANKEAITVDQDALALIAEASEGSVRDSLSLLDQAIAHSSTSGATASVTAALVRDMLGLADRTALFDMLEAIVSGEIPAALEKLRSLYHAGADSILILEDLLELTHFITKLHITPSLAESRTLPEAERVRGAQLAEKLSIPHLTRMWQMLLKGLQEARQAPSSLAAAEMILIRLGYAAPLPPPASLIKDIINSKYNSSPAVTAPVASPAPAAPVSYIAPPSANQPAPASFDEVVALFRERKEMVLYHALLEDVHLVSFEIGRIELSLTVNAATDIAGKISKFLMEWTGARWLVIITKESGKPTLQQQKDALEQSARDKAALHPVVKAVLDNFPGSSITAVRANSANNEAVTLIGEQQHG
jgi:DNA polymerase III subunit gamma/tau